MDDLRRKLMAKQLRIVELHQALDGLVAATYLLFEEDIAPQRRERIQLALEHAEAALERRTSRMRSDTTGSLLTRVKASEVEAIRSALQASGWNVTQAAQRLGIDRTNLHRKMKSLGVTRPR